MRRWDELSRPARIVIGVAIAILAVVVPEISFLMLMGGIDFTWLVLLTFLAPAFTAAALDAHFLFLAARHCLARSLLAQPPAFATSAAFAVFTFLISGSLFAATLCIAPIVLQA